MSLCVCAYVDKDLKFSILYAKQKRQSSSHTACCAGNETDKNNGDGMGCDAIKYLSFN